MKKGVEVWKIWFAHIPKLSIVPLIITPPFPFLDFRVEDLRFVVRRGFGSFGKNCPGVEESGVEMLWRLEPSRHDKDLSRNVSRRRRFRSLDFGKQLVEDPKKFVVLLGPKHFRNERATFDKKLGS